MIGVAAPAANADGQVAPGTVRAEDYTRTDIYAAPQLPPRYTAWVGAWIMPDQSLMTAFTQATGPLEGRSTVPPEVLASYGLTSLALDRDFTGLDLSAVYLRSTDGGTTWDPWRSDSFHAIAPHGYSGQAVMGLADGTILRRVNGWDTQGYSSAPPTAYLQRLTPGATDWNEPQILMDPSQFTYQITRFQRLRDGRIIATGNYWRTPAGTPYNNVPASDQGWLLMVSADEGLTWTNALTEPADQADRAQPNEWDVAELDDGDLLAMMRTWAVDSLGHRTIARRQALLHKLGDGWVMDPPTPTPFAPSGHPELLATREGPVLYIATNGTTATDGGIFYTRDRGATWTRLDFSPAQSYRSTYYPSSLETQDGTIHVFGHRGSDDPYRAGLDQAIVMDTFRLDMGAPPRPTVTRAPPSATPDTTADFEFTAESGATTQCALDDAEFADCTSPVSYSSLALGQHRFRVKQTVGSLESEPEVRQWTIQGPKPTIVDAPPDPTADLEAVFSFTGAEGATFECALDGAEFAGCASPMTYTGLGAGRHVLLIRQVIDGLASASETYRWTVTGPDPPVLDGVPATGQPRRSVSYAFSGSTGTYECTVDSATSYAPCTSPMALDGLALGSHTFSVRAVDDRDLRSDPVSHTFSIRDTVAPALVNKPPAATTATTATFSFTGEDPQFVTFACLLDGQPVTPCAPGQDTTLTPVAPGDHSFRVVEQLGSLAPKQASFAWTVAQPPPVTGGYRGVVLADGPVGYWRLGELSGSIAADALGFSPGTATAGARLGAVAGAVAGDGGASFDGKTSQVSVPDAARLRTGDVFSLEVWVRPSKLAITHAILSKGASYLLYLDQNKVVLRQPNVGTIVSSTASIADTALWHHVVVTKAHSAAKVYLDGVDVSGSVSQHTVTDGNGALAVGSGASRFTGGLDEVAVYGKALSAADVARHYASR